MRRSLSLVVIFLVVGSHIAATQLVDERTRRKAIDHYRSGQELMYRERFEHAAEEYQKAIDLDPLLTLAHYGLGQAFMNLRRYPDAVTAFTGCRDAYERLAGLVASHRVDVESRREDELRELQESIRLVRSGRVKYVSDHQLLKLEERVKDLERGRQRQEQGTGVPAEVFLSLGSARFRSGQLADAEREWLQAVRIKPTFGEAHNNLAAIYLMTGRPLEADQSVKRAEEAGYQVPSGLKDDIKKALEQK